MTQKCCPNIWDQHSGSFFSIFHPDDESDEKKYSQRTVKEIGFLTLPLPSNIHDRRDLHCMSTPDRFHTELYTTPQFSEAVAETATTIRVSFPSIKLIQGYKKTVLVKSTTN